VHTRKPGSFPIRGLLHRAKLLSSCVRVLWLPWKRSLLSCRQKERLHKGFAICTFPSVVVGILKDKLSLAGVMLQRQSLSQKHCAVHHILRAFIGFVTSVKLAHAGRRTSVFSLRWGRFPILERRLRVAQCQQGEFESHRSNDCI